MIVLSIHSHYLVHGWSAKFFEDQTCNNKWLWKDKTMNKFQFKLVSCPYSCNISEKTPTIPHPDLGHFGWGVVNFAYNTDGLPSCRCWSSWTDGPGGSWSRPRGRPSCRGGLHDDRWDCWRSWRKRPPPWWFWWSILRNSQYEPSRIVSILNL